MKLKNIRGSAFLLILLLTGCGTVTVTNNESDSVLDSVVDSVSVTKTGIGTYVDSAVEGVTYVCGTQSGTTDKDGTFSMI